MGLFCAALWRAISECFALCHMGVDVVLWLPSEGIEFNMAILQTVYCLRYCFSIQQGLLQFWSCSMHFLFRYPMFLLLEHVLDSWTKTSARIF